MKLFLEIELRKISELEEFIVTAEKNVGALDFDTHAWRLEGNELLEDDVVKLIFDYEGKGYEINELNYVGFEGELFDTSTEIGIVNYLSRLQFDMPRCLTRSRSYLSE